MIPPELLAMIRCPATGQTLALCTAEMIAAVNKRVADKAGAGLVNTGGRPILEPITAALLRADGGILYPVLDDIPVLLAEDGIVPPLA